MAELMFGLGQTKKKKETEAKIKQIKAEEWNYKGRIDQDGTHLERKEKANREQKWKEDQRTTRKNLKDVTQGETGEMTVRKEQHSREKKWKETGRNQIKSNTNFDMARSLFGGGGPAPPRHQDDDEEEEQEIDEVAEKLETTTLETEDEEPLDDENSNEEQSQDDHEPNDDDSVQDAYDEEED